MEERVRPFNFLLSASVRPFGHPVGADPTKFHLVHRYEDDLVTALNTEWTDLHSSQNFRVTTDAEAPPDVAQIKSYGDVLNAFLVHPEPKSADRTGKPCDRRTRGLLYRRRVGIAKLVFHGKEANQLEDVQNGLVHNWDDVCAKYVNPALDPWRTDVLPRLRELPTNLLAERADITPRAVREILSGRGLPSARTRVAFLEALEAQEEPSERIRHAPKRAKGQARKKVCRGRRRPRRSRRKRPKVP